MNKAKTKTLGSAMFLVVWVVAYLYWGNLYFLRSLETTSQDIVTLKKEIAELSRQKQKLTEGRGQFQNLAEEMETVRGAVAAEGETVKFIEKIETMAKTEGVKLSLQVAPSVAADTKNNNRPAEDPYFSEKAFVLSVRGPYGGVMKFLYNLENLNYFVNLKDFSLKTVSSAAVSVAAADESSRQEVELSANLTLYQLKP